MLQHVHCYSSAVGAFGVDLVITVAGHGRPGIDGAASVICAEIAGCDVYAREGHVHRVDAVKRGECLSIAVGREVGGVSAGERGLLVVKGGIRILLVVVVIRSSSICPGVIVWA